MDKLLDVNGRNLMIRIDTKINVIWINDEIQCLFRAHKSIISLEVDDRLIIDEGKVVNDVEEGGMEVSDSSSATRDRDSGTDECGCSQSRGAEQKHRHMDGGES